MRAMNWMAAGLLLANGAMAMAADAPATGTPATPPAATQPAPRAHRGMPRLTPEEQFRQFDTNHDGMLSQQEFVDGMKKLHERMRRGRRGGHGEEQGPPAPPKST